MSIPVTLLPGTLPYDCYPSPQQLNVDIVERISAFVALAFTGLYASPTPPPADQRDKIWFNTTVQRLYQYVNGAWQRTYLPSASNGELRMIEVSVDTYNAQEGGDPTITAIGDSTGPLWVLAPEYTGRMPLGAGLIPTSDPPITTALGDTGGAYQAISGVDALPEHHHTYSLKGAEGTDLDPASARFAALPNSPGSGSGALPDFNFDTSSVGADPATTKPPATIPPYKAVNFVRRTARKYVQSPF